MEILETIIIGILCILVVLATLEFIGKGSIRSFIVLLILTALSVILSSLFKKG